ncbi:MAG: leucyl/phenylalanyl-tRNA--protein transferase, partial [Lachnospiraceae bacterium]|nr:leucyl/phenylalanyl-tRNA--protein transferase [Lachnospiraceae bacterium]
KCFFGESMFSEKENGSKLALIALAGILGEKDYCFIDCQFYTEHLERMGGKYVEWESYWALLKEGTS